MKYGKRNLIKSRFPEATCRRMKGQRQYYIVCLWRDLTETVAVGGSAMEAWALAYDRLKEKGRLQ